MAAKPKATKAKTPTAREEQKAAPVRTAAAPVQATTAAPETPKSLEILALKKQIAQEAKKLRVERAGSRVSLPPIAVFALLIIGLAAGYVVVGGTTAGLMGLLGIQQPESHTTNEPSEETPVEEEPVQPTTPPEQPPAAPPVVQPTPQPTPQPSPQPQARLDSCTAMQNFSFVSSSYDGQAFELVLVNNSNRVIRLASVEATTAGSIGGGNASTGRWEVGSEAVFTISKLSKNVSQDEEYEAKVNVRATDLLGATIADSTTCTGTAA